MSCLEQWRTGWLRCFATNAPPVAVAQPAAPPAQPTPPRISSLFKKFDKDSDGRLTLEELTAAMVDEFPSLPEYARARLPELFAEYAITTKERSSRRNRTFLPEERFRVMYGRFLFYAFDRDANGHLDVHEAEEALSYLSAGQPVCIALPSEWRGESVRVSNTAFEEMYMKMMGR
jgi:hypothetical protein